LAAQTGASLFLQVHCPPYVHTSALPPSSNWTYNKTESLTPSGLTFSPEITHLIVESDTDMEYFVTSGEWVLVDSVSGFEGWRMPRKDVFRRIGKVVEELNFWDLVPRMEKKNRLWIVERKSWVS